MYLTHLQDDESYSHRIEFVFFPSFILQALGMSITEVWEYSNQPNGHGNLSVESLLDVPTIFRRVPKADLSDWVWFNAYHRLLGNEHDERFPGLTNGRYPLSTNRVFAHQGDLPGVPDHDTTALSRATGLRLFSQNAFGANALHVNFMDLRSYIGKHHDGDDPITYRNINHRPMGWLIDDEAFFGFATGKYPDELGLNGTGGFTVGVNPCHLGVLQDTHVIGLFPYPVTDKDFYVDGVSVHDTAHPKGQFFRKLYSLLRGMSVPAHQIIDRGLMDGYVYQSRVNGMVVSQIR